MRRRGARLEGKEESAEGEGRREERTWTEATYKHSHYVAMKLLTDREPS